MLSEIHYAALCNKKHRILLCNQASGEIKPDLKKKKKERKTSKCKISMQQEKDDSKGNYRICTTNKWTLGSTIL